MIGLEGNSEFMKLLKERKKDRESKYHKIDIGLLSKLLLCKIIIYRNCYLLENFTSKKRVDTLLERTDRTGVEQEENHLHVKDLLPRRIIGNKELITVGLLIVQILSAKIKEYCTEGTFIVMLSCDTKNRKDLRDCVIRFFRVRTDEPIGMDEDIDSYISQAVARLTINRDIS